MKQVYFPLLIYRTLTIKVFVDKIRGSDYFFNKIKRFCENVLYNERKVENRIRFSGIILMKSRGFMWVKEEWPDIIKK